MTLQQIDYYIAKNHYSLPRIKSHIIIKVFDLKKLHFNDMGVKCSLTRFHIKG